MARGDACNYMICRTIALRSRHSFLRQGLSRPEGRIAFSEITIDTEQREVIQAFLPIDHQGKIVGMLGILANIGPTLEKIRQFFPPPYALYLTNSQLQVFPQRSEKHRSEATIFVPPLPGKTLPPAWTRKMDSLQANMRWEQSTSILWDDISFVFFLKIPFQTDLPDHFLGMAVAVGSDVIDHRLSPIKRQSLLLGSGILLGGILLTVLFARTFTRPMAQIAQAMADFGDGNRDATATLTVKSRDEIGLLAQSFSRMAQQIIFHEQESALKEQELQTLSVDVKQSVAFFCSVFLLTLPFHPHDPQKFFQTKYNNKYFKFFQSFICYRHFITNSASVDSRAGFFKAWQGLPSGVLRWGTEA